MAWALPSLLWRGGARLFGEEAVAGRSLVGDEGPAAAAPSGHERPGLGTLGGLRGGESGNGGAEAASLGGRGARTAALHAPVATAFGNLEARSKTFAEEMCVCVSRAGARAAGGLGRPGETCEKALGQEGGNLAETGECS